MSKNNWVFLRGLTRGTVHWGPFPEIFKDKNSEIHTEFLEIPGNGLLNKLGSPMSPVTAINFLRQNCKFSKSNVPFHICGISLGGMIALKWAELYPDEIQSVSIINSSLRQFSPISKRLIPKNYGKIIYSLFNSDSLAQEKTILEITSNNFQKTKIFLSTFAEFSAIHPISKINFVKQLLLASNIKINILPKIPLKVISAKNDRLVDSSCSENIAQALKGTSIIHPTAGHDLPLDDPHWLSDILLRSNS